MLNVLHQETTTNYIISAFVSILKPEILYTFTYHIEIINLKRYFFTFITISIILINILTVYQYSDDQ